jgi:hypothetical protein
LGINCWSVRCHDTCMLTDCYQVATIPPLFWLPGYLAYRTVGSNLVVSVAWQWLFSTLDNSASQTTCHSINTSSLVTCFFNVDAYCIV